MLITYNFEIYYYKDKENLADLLLCRLDYIISNKREKENSLKIFILKRVRFKILTINLDWEEESLNLELLIKVIIKTVIYFKRS